MQFGRRFAELEPSKRDLRRLREARLLITANIMHELGLFDSSGRIDQEAKSKVYFTALDRSKNYGERSASIINLAKIYDATLYNHDLVRLTTAIAALVMTSKDVAPDRTNAKIFSDLAKKFSFIGIYTLPEIRRFAELQMGSERTIYMHFKKVE